MVRPTGGAQRARAVDTTVAKDAVESLAANNDTAQRTGRPGSRVLDDIVIVTGTPKVVNHGCGSARVKWVVCDMRSASGAMVWRTDLDERSITLNASANCTISIEVWST